MSVRDCVLLSIMRCWCVCTADQSIWLTVIIWCDISVRQMWREIVHSDWCKTFALSTALISKLLKRKTKINLDSNKSERESDWTEFIWVVGWLQQHKNSSFFVVTAELETSVLSSTKLIYDCEIKIESEFYKWFLI